MMWSSKGGEAQPHELAVLEEGPGERNEHSHVTLQETDAKEAHQSYDETGKNTVYRIYGNFLFFGV